MVNNNEYKKYSLFEVWHYFQHLYDKIDGVYSCTRIKLEKLILIGVIEYYNRTGKKLIYDLKTYNTEAGLRIDTKDVCYRCLITYSQVTKNEPMKISKSELMKVNTSYSCACFFDEIFIEDDVKSILIDVFIKYGSYSGAALNEILNNGYEVLIMRLEAFDFKNTYKLLPINKYAESMKLYLNDLIELAQIDPKKAKEIAEKTFRNQGLVEDEFIQQLVKKQKKDKI